jgi:AcrR family transcriptional regulator
MSKEIRQQMVRDVKSTLILNAAHKVFAQKGFHETRLEDIAAEAGFSKASLYNYFTDKEEIFLSLAVKDFEELLEQVHKGVLESNTLESSLEFVFEMVFSYFSERFSFFWAINNYQIICNLGAQRLQGHHDELLDRFSGYYNDLLDTFSKVIKNAQDQKQIESLTDPMLLSRFVAALVRGIVMEWKINGKTDNIKTIVNELTLFTLQGIGFKKS